MKIKHILLITGVLLSFWSMVLALPPGMTEKPAKVTATQGLDTETMINVNNLQMFVTNQGGYAEDWALLLETLKNDGLYFPAGTDKTVLFSAGIWVGGLVNDSIRLAVGAFDTPEYAQGPADASGNAQPDRARYRVYKLVRDSTAWLDPEKGGIETNAGVPFIRLDSSRHWNDPQLWVDSAALDGAPLDTAGKPVLIGDQTLWCVFNDGGEHNYDSYGGGTEPLGVELQSTFWGYELPALANTIFVKWVIINKSSNQIDSAYVSLWADPDLGGASDDFVGCDIETSLGYCFNATNNDNVYGSTPPAVGFDFLQGPIVRQGDPIYPDTLFDDAIVVLNTGDTIYNAIKLGMESFNKYINGTDPDVPEESYGYMKGLDAKAGGPYIHPFTGEITQYFGSGDPVTDTGWIDTNPADRRFMLSTGPFTFNPGDTQVVVAAIVVGQGGDRKTSVTALRYFDDLSQFAYDQNFIIPSPPPRPVVTSRAFDRKVTLTWTNRSEADYDEPRHVFEGYVVYQGETVSGPWTRVATYDIKNGDGILNNDELDPDLGVVVDRPVVFGSDAGLKHYIEIDQDYVRGGSLHNGSDYYYAVTAYAQVKKAFADSVPTSLRVLENSQQAITITPGVDLPGTDWETAEADTLADYSRLDTEFNPTTDIVTVQVVDPRLVTGHEYRVVFRDIYPDTTYDTTSADPLDIDTTYIWPDTTDVLEDGQLVNIHKYWELWDATDGVRLLEKQTNKSGDENYQVVDGILVKVIGVHEPSLLNVSYIDNDTTHEDGLLGVNWGGFYYGGGVDYGYYFFGSSLNPETSDISQFTTVEVRFNEVTAAGASLEGGQYAYNYCRGCDPSYGYQGYFQVPFQVWDVPNNRQLNAAFVEWNGSGAYYDSTWHPDIDANSGGREYLFILNSDYSGDTDPLNTPIDYTSLNILGEGDSFDVLYALWPSMADEDAVVDSGDVLRFQFGNPADANDVFSFSTDAPIEDDAALAKSVLDDVKVVPNPYYAFSRYELDQFDRQVRFLGVPDDYTIRIFNIAGDKVRTMDASEKNPGQSWAIWDLTTDAGLYVAPGIYIWYLVAPGIGETYGKMAIFPEVEQLQVY